MTKLVLSKEKSDKLIKMLSEIANHNVKIAPFSDDEVAFAIPKEEEAIFFKLLTEIIDQENEFWLDTFEGLTKYYPSNCMYFEVVGEDVVLVTDFYKKVGVRHTLQELEEKLNELEFLRISKSAIVNLKKISHIRPLINSKVELTLLGNIKLEVNRSYLKAFKKALKEKGGF